VSVHVGTRLQATVVLSCPGVAVDPLVSRSGSEAVPPSSTFEEELASLRRRLTTAAERRRREAERRRGRLVRALSEDDRWVDEEEVRRTLASRRLVPSEKEYLPEEPPASEEGLERLPMYFDGRGGPVALSQGLGGWEAIELSAEGGSQPVGIAVAPSIPPSLEADAEALLSGYLRYWLARDGFLGAVVLETANRAEGSVLDVALADLHAIGSDVLARGAFRAKLRGEAGVRLSRRDVELGIRATDQDWLDRPTWGSRL
jgi:hypothetical protein